MEISRKSSAILLQATVGVSIQKDGNCQAQKLEEHLIAKKVPISQISKAYFLVADKFRFFLLVMTRGESKQTKTTEDKRNICYIDRQIYN